MFTGLVTDIGEIVAVRQAAEGLRRLKVACGYPRASIGEGASIACAGVCLTVVGIGDEGDGAWFAADAAAAHARATSRETIGAAGVRGVEANFALSPLTQRRQRSVSW